MAYSIGTSSYLLDSDGKPVGMLGSDGSEWLFPPSAEVSGTAAAAEIREAGTLFDMTTGAPIGFVTAAGSEQFFADPMVRNTSLRGLRISPLAELLSAGGAVVGPASVASRFAWRDPLVGAPAEPEPEPEPTIPLADMPEGVTVVGRWSANHSALTVDAGRVTQVTNLVAGMPAMVAQGLGRGALDRTDASGKRLLRFIGWELMEVGEGMGQLDNRNCTVIAVMRPYVNASVANHSTIVSLSNENGGTGTSGQGMARITMQGGAAKPSLTGQTTDSEACFAGAQLQVLTFAGRTTANGGSLILINNEVVHQGAQANTAGGGDKGIEIGRHPTASPTGPGNWALMDIYELVVIAGTVTNQQAADAAAALVAAYGIVPIEHTLIVDGASTFNGWSAGDPLSEVERGDNICGVLSEPGGPHALPANWRVIQQAVSGSTGIDLKTRRDAAAAAGMEPRAGGRNEVAWGFGFNDHGDGATGEDIVQRTRDLLTDGADAYLVKGWKCYPGINPSVGNSAVTNTLDAARALMFGAAQADFLDSVDAGASDTYEGMVEPWALHEWEVGGVAIFGSSGEAVNGIGTYYANDSVHMTAEGCRQLALSLRARMGF